MLESWFCGCEPIYLYIGYLKILLKWGQTTLGVIQHSWSPYKQSNFGQPVRTVSDKKTNGRVTEAEIGQSTANLPPPECHFRKSVASSHLILDFSLQNREIIHSCHSNQPGCNICYSSLGKPRHICWFCPWEWVTFSCFCMSNNFGVHPGQREMFCRVDPWCHVYFSKQPARRGFHGRSCPQLCRCCSYAQLLSIFSSLPSSQEADGVSVPASATHMTPTWDWGPPWGKS